VASPVLFEICGPPGVYPQRVGILASPEQRVDIAEFTGVYARYVNYRGGPERSDFSKLEQQMIDAEYQLSLMQLLDLLPALW
jgi:hypothetical protein